MSSLEGVIVQRLIYEVSDLKARVQALWSILEKRGVPLGEVEEAYGAAKAQARRKLEADLEKARRAAQLGELRKSEDVTPQ